MNKLSIFNASATDGTVQTMSTREVATLIGKQHNHIKVSAERLAANGVIGTPAAREFDHNGNTYTEYLLNKRDSIILVAQNCPEFTAAIVDRWQELEQVKSIPSNLLPTHAAPQFEALFKLAQLMGCDKNAAAISANQGTIAVTGLNLLGIMGMTHLPSEKQAIYYTPTELGKMCEPSLSAIKVNQALKYFGLQRGKESGHWEPSEEGKEFCTILDTGKKHSNGVPVQQVKWSAEVLKIIGLKEKTNV